MAAPERAGVHGEDLTEVAGDRVFPSSWKPLMAEAWDLARATIDFCGVLGLLLGLMIGFELATQLPSQTDLTTALVRATLFGKLGTVLVSLVLGLRVMTDQNWLRERWQQLEVLGHPMLVHMAALAWAAVCVLFFFYFAALLGYAFGIELAPTGNALDALDRLAVNYPLTDLPRNAARVVAEGAALGWIHHFDAELMARADEHLSRSATRKAIAILLAVSAIEALDSYLYWIVF